jgi:voltage-gated potassium channel
MPDSLRYTDADWATVNGGRRPRRGLRGAAPTTLVSLPERKATPGRQLLYRVLAALAMLLVITLVVYVDRDAYNDNADGQVGFIDALYYATVTMTTTGYGDITPDQPHSRIINVVIVTPLRVAFLVLLVGTTVEVLATEGRRIFLDSRWRKHMRNHVVVIGYGTKGRSAVQTLTDSNVDPAKLVVIDGRPGVIAEANLQGIAAINGDATRREILRRAEISKARDVIITLDRDDSAILVALTVRQMNPSAHMVVAVREQDNAPLLRQSGADSVVTSSEAVGRVLGLSSISPNLGTVIEDLLTANEGIEFIERQVRPDEVGKNPAEISDERVLAVVRNKTLRQFYDPTVQALETGDQLVVVRHAPEG